jgi:hypothetical protein
MAIRTTEEAVGAIIEVDSDISLTPFIETGSALTDQVAAAPSPPDATRLELIERYLSAHAYTLRAPRAIQERAGSVGETFQSRVDLGLATSHYGQMAMSLDPTGVLASLSKGKKAVGVQWGGKDADRGLAEGT